MKLWIVVIAFAVAGVFARAQEAGRFHFSSPWKADVSRESGLPVGKSEVDDFAATASLPAFNFIHSRPRSHLSLQYRPEYEVFYSHSNLNGWNHAANLAFRYTATPRVTVEAAHAFVKTQDPTRTLPGIFPLLPRGRFRENITSLAVHYDFSRRTLLRFGFDNAASSFSAPGGTEQARFSQLANALTGEVSRALSDRQQITGSYSWLHFRDRDAGDGMQATPSRFLGAHNAAFAYRYHTESRLLLELSAGMLAGHGTSSTVSALIEKRWTRTTLAVGYARELPFLSDRGLILRSPEGVSSGALPASLSHAATVTWKQRLGGRISTEMTASAGSAPSKLAPGDIRGLSGRLALYWRLSRRVFAFAGSTFYRQNFNELVGASMDRRRHSAGVIIYVSPPPGAAESAGPDHGAMLSRGSGGWDGVEK